LEFVLCAIGALVRVYSERFEGSIESLGFVKDESVEVDMV
jgi:hypothetical protein